MKMCPFFDWMDHTNHVYPLTHEVEPEKFIPPPIGDKICENVTKWFEKLRNMRTLAPCRSLGKDGSDGQSEKSKEQLHGARPSQGSRSITYCIYMR